MKTLGLLFFVLTLGRSAWTAPQCYDVFQREKVYRESSEFLETYKNGISENPFDLIRIYQNNSVFLVLRLDKLASNSEGYRWAQKYFNEFLPRVYQQKLNKDQQFFEEVRDANVDIFSRTTLILSLLRSPGGIEEIAGGLAFVTAKGKSESLPFQDELQSDTVVSLLPDSYPSLEIARVSFAANKEAQVSFKDMLKIVVLMLKTEKVVKNFFAFTSTTHVRLYSRYGLRFQSFLEDKPGVLEKDDQVFTLDRH